MDREKILQFIENSPQRNIFCYPWWLEAVAPGRYQYIIAEKGKNIEAVLPVVIKEKLGQKQVVMPPFTQYAGILFPKVKDKYVMQLSQQHLAMEALIEKLPVAIYINLKFHISINNWLPFYWKGFSQTTRYTYLLNDIKDHEKLKLELHPKTKRAIFNSKVDFEVREIDDIDVLIALYIKTFKKQGITIKNSEIETIKRIYSVCRQRNQGQLLAAIDAQNNVHSCQLFVWDDVMAYYLISGTDPEFLNSQAAYHVLWEGIKFCSQHVDQFNFEGSMIAGVERFFRRFGAIQTPYLNVYKFKPKWLGIARLLKEK
ncbi:MAG: peptidoglycan bridge formation glycyltransferase FemA/FemB family protein [Candidatus Marinimicrobia bacterium]|nr:peptidoglycan bridge formation glycyltransferase FemA/FemB family protein [Candidatus Neomarinimicrobiota bacterium]